jgi:hypothetical protein
MHPGPILTLVLPVWEQEAWDRTATQMFRVLMKVARDPGEVRENEIVQCAPVLEHAASPSSTPVVLGQIQTPNRGIIWSGSDI